MMKYSLGMVLLDSSLGYGRIAREGCGDLGSSIKLDHHGVILEYVVLPPVEGHLQTRNSVKEKKVLFHAHAEIIHFDWVGIWFESLLDLYKSRVFYYGLDWIETQGKSIILRTLDVAKCVNIKFPLLLLSRLNCLLLGLLLLLKEELLLLGIHLLLHFDDDRLIMPIAEDDVLIAMLSERDADSIRRSINNAYCGG
jgi:hypothetical protein